jgi:hypothetical protein
MPKVIPQGPPGTIWFGGAPDEVSLCLRVWGDALDPDAVSRVLSREPSRCQRKGEPVLSPAGEVQRIARTGSWLLDFPVGGDSTVGEAIDALLKSLPGDPAIWASLTSRFAVDLICDLTVRCVNRGFELPPELLGLLSRRGITLSFDIFCQADPGEVEALRRRLGSAEQGAPADRAAGK